MIKRMGWNGLQTRYNKSSQSTGFVWLLLIDCREVWCSLHPLKKDVKVNWRRRKSVSRIGLRLHIVSSILSFSFETFPSFNQVIPVVGRGLLTYCFLVIRETAKIFIINERQVIVIYSKNTIGYNCWRKSHTGFKLLHDLIMDYKFDPCEE